MYEEVKPAIDMRESKGSFAVTISDGQGTRTNLAISDNGGVAVPLSLDRVFSNAGTLTFDASTCAPTFSSYSPSIEDGRSLVVEFKDETMADWEPIPSQTINYVPFAFEAKKVSGFPATSLLRVADGGIPGNIAPLSNAEYQKILDLISGSSSVYQKAGFLGGAAIPSTTSLTTGQVLTWNSVTSAWIASTPNSSGSVVTTSLADGAVTAAKLSPSTPTAGQVLAVDGAGALTWKTAKDSQWTTHGANVSYDVVGKVGIGTTTPRSSLDVSGVISTKPASDQTSFTTIDFSTGNIQYTNDNCQPFQLNNLKDGTTYTFVIKGTASSACSFTTYSDAGTSALTPHLPPGHVATTPGKHTLYSFMVVGGDVYFAWIPGY